MMVGSPKETERSPARAEPENLEVNLGFKNKGGKTHPLCEKGIRKEMKNAGGRKVQGGLSRHIMILG